ncbi:MAG: hypothetical protein RLY76_387 [Actinomycetota bacterium]|jgi:hypothetical protein
MSYLAPLDLIANLTLLKMKFSQNLNFPNFRGKGSEENFRTLVPLLLYGCYLAEEASATSLSKRAFMRTAARPAFSAS